LWLCSWSELAQDSIMAGFLIHVNEFPDV